MEIDEIKTKIKFTLDVVGELDLDEDYKIESFKIVLNKLLNSSDKSVGDVYSNEKEKHETPELSGDPMDLFAHEAG